MTKKKDTSWAEGKASPVLLRRYIRLEEARLKELKKLAERVNVQGGERVTVTEVKLSKETLARTAAQELVHPTPFPKLKRRKK